MNNIISDSRTSDIFGIKSQFKCCKSKIFNNFCCKVCYGIFHDSCIARRKGVVSLEGHVIICSRECAEKHSTNNSEANIPSNLNLNNSEKCVNGRTLKEHECDLENLNKYIEELSIESDEKDIYIKSLLKIVENFQMQIDELTGSINFKFENQRSLITDLNKENNEILTVNELLKSNLEDSLMQVRNFEERLSEFHKVKEDMIQTIKMLTEDNGIYASELFHLKNKLTSEVTDCVNNPFYKASDVLEEKHTKVDPGKINALVGNGRRKMLILSDEYGRHLDSLIKKCGISSLQTETIIKPGALFRNVVEDIANLTKHYTINDYVLIIAGTNDFKQRKYPIFKEIQSRIRYCTSTNIIFTSVPSIHCLKEHHESLKKYNRKLSEYASRLNRITEGTMSFVEFCTSKGRLLKNILASNILMEIGNPRKHLKNLKFISCSEDVDVRIIAEDLDNTATNFLGQSSVTKMKT